MMRPWPIAAGVLLMSGIAGCLSSNARPGFAPMPEARSADVELDPIEATKLLAENLQDAGIPVATVAIDGSMNAALLVVTFLAVTDTALAEQLAAFRVEIAGG